MRMPSTASTVSWFISSIWIHRVWMCYIHKIPGWKWDFALSAWAPPHSWEETVSWIAKKWVWFTLTEIPLLLDFRGTIPSCLRFRSGYRALSYNTLEHSSHQLLFEMWKRGVQCFSGHLKPNLRHTIWDTLEGFSLVRSDLCKHRIDRLKKWWFMMKIFLKVRAGWVWYEWEMTSTTPGSWALGLGNKASHLNNCPIHGAQKHF